MIFFTAKEVSGIQQNSVIEYQFKDNLKMKYKYHWKKKELYVVYRNSSRKWKADIGKEIYSSFFCLHSSLEWLLI